MKEVNVLEALRVAQNVPYKPARPSGCGRAYVCVMTPDVDKKAKRKFHQDLLKACAELQLIFNVRGHGVGRNAIYIGYDNCDGKALGRSEAFAKSLCDAGIQAYPDAADD